MKNFLLRTSPKTGTGAHARRTWRARAAFTLIELLVVMVVISVLVTITFSISQYAAWRAREAQAKVMREQIRAALEGYRADYGEYPITVSPGNARHYAEAYDPNFLYASGGTNIMPWTNINLTSNTVMQFTGFSGSVSHNYSLTYPLMIAQIEKGNKPYMEFPVVPIMHLSYNLGTRPSDYISEVRTPTGRVLRYLRTRPIFQARAVDPASGAQYRYESDDGVTYSLRW